LVRSSMTGACKQIVFAFNLVPIVEYSHVEFEYQ